MSLPFRILGYVTVIAALAAGFHDIYQSVFTDSLVLTPLGDLWYLTSQSSFEAFHAWLLGTAPDLWDPAMQVVLRLPAWLALFILATLILLIAQLIYRPR
ncbi:hypothetical protein [Acuticoccus kandeliae]|uniref:hypothetical protein n=1 Tax=Acuticoccus kandeliae TaxID=2073160 RepID=UPI000D3E89D8|nr:hypothetical protein [Acuticoccus kandeliae]